MYAVIKSGGKQYRVMEGQSIRVEKLNAEVGNSIELDQVLMLADGNNIKIGDSLLKGCLVKAEVIAHGRADKIKIIKMKRRKHHMKRMGHRQWYTEVKITSILAA